MEKLHIQTKHDGEPTTPNRWSKANPSKADNLPELGVSVTGHVKAAGVRKSRWPMSTRHGCSPKQHCAKDGHPNRHQPRDACHETIATRMSDK
jgi:hypothetical protein